MNLSDWPYENALAIFIGLLLSLWALSRLFIIGIIRVFIALKTIKSNKSSIEAHIHSTEEKFKDLNEKVNHISEKIDKIYTILIDK